MADFKVILSKRRVIALSDLAKELMFNKTCGICKLGVHDATYESNILRYILCDINYKKLSVVDGNGKKMNKKRIYKV